MRIAVVRAVGSVVRGVMVRLLHPGKRVDGSSHHAGVIHLVTPASRNLGSVGTVDGEVHLYLVVVN